MCGPIDPSTIGNAGLIMQGFGAINSTIGAYKQSQAAKSSYEYQAQVASWNAHLADRRASDAITRGQTDEGTQRLKAAGIYSAQRATLAARGLDLGEGSALNILADTKFMGEVDALTIRNNAAREAYGYQYQAANDRFASDFYKGRAGAESPLVAGGTSLLAGAGQVATSWYRLKKG